MNILVVSPAYAPYAGVGSVRMMSLTKFLVEKKDKVIVLRNAPELWPKKTLKSTPPEGVEVRDVYAKGDFKSCMMAYEQAVREVLECYQIDVSIYSCNPYYTAPVAAQMKAELGAKYILDFRDLWIKDEALTRSLPRKIKKFLVRFPYRKFEKKAIQMADVVTTVTPRDCECLKKQYKNYSNKMQVVYNGYDETRMNVSLENEKNYPFPYIAVFGKFGYYDFKYLTEMLLAVKKVNDSGSNLKIVHIGDLDSKTQKALKTTKFPEDLYINTGFLDYAQGINILKNAKMCCLIVHYKRGLGTKIFDYIYVNKPVIYFAQADSAISDVLKECDSAYRCDNQKDAEKAIMEIINDNIIELGCAKVEMYSRKIQNAHFYDIMNAIIEEK